MARKDKMAIQQLPQGLSNLGYGLVSSGGTARALSEAGLEVQQVEELTQFPEMMDGTEWLLGSQASSHTP